MKKFFPILLIPITLALITTILMAQTKTPQTNKSQVCFNNYCFNVELAITLEEQKHGLMGREYLPINEGMLFIYGQKTVHTFWMKNMLIPLDIIWINENEEVIHIKKNVQPCPKAPETPQETSQKTSQETSQKAPCPSFTPDNLPSKFTHELNAGTVDKIGLKVGDKLTLKIN